MAKSSDFVSRPKRDTIVKGFATIDNTYLIVTKTGTDPLVGIELDREEIKSLRDALNTYLRETAEAK